MGLKPPSSDPRNFAHLQYLLEPHFEVFSSRGVDGRAAGARQLVEWFGLTARAIAARPRLSYAAADRAMALRSRFAKIFGSGRCVPSSAMLKRLLQEWIPGLVRFCMIARLHETLF